MKRNIINITGLLLSLMCAFALCGCGGENIDSVDEALENASEALTMGSYDYAQQLCDEVAEIALGPDSAQVGEVPSARLGILYMKLSEHCNEDENVAEATQCLRRAFRLSADSLKTFSLGLPLEDERHFVLLRRLGTSIDNPVDLTKGDLIHEGYSADSI